MTKSKTFDAYNGAVTEAAERVLVTLLRGFGPWKDTVFLVGGLTPRYLVAARPPEVPQHAGTGDVDVVVDVAILTDTEAYSTLEENLHAMGFERGTNENGVKVSWRWEARLETGATMVLEFLAEHPELGGGKVKVLPTEGNVSALNIPHASMVFDLHDTTELTAELLNGGGLATEVVRYANIVSFTCLKAFAFDHRNARKDAHDLVYCLEHYPGGLDSVISAFKDALAGPHAEAVQEALAKLKTRFVHDDPDQSYRRDGAVAVARFEDNDADVDDNEEIRDLRILRQRQVADLMGQFFAALA
ncbi:antitoxin [Novosphingobium subterraneum]|uniref:antitoxin n=1 Tax=Novosphingobium subterraneum TaxID=48936 RepID=UPI003CFC6E14